MAGDDTVVNARNTRRGAKQSRVVCEFLYERQHGRYPSKYIAQSRLVLSIKISRDVC